MIADTVLLLPGSPTSIGGAPMRWRALRDALTTPASTLHEVTCDRRGPCSAVCANTSTPRPDRGRIWYHNRKFCPAYADTLAAAITAADVSTVVCSGLETFEYVNHFATLGTIRVIYDMHNIEHLLYRDIQHAAPPDSLHARLFTDEHITMVAAAEASAIASATVVWCCTPDDRRTILATFPGTSPDKVRVVPNVVPVPAAPPAPGPPRHACFIGRLDHYPNILAARTLTEQVAPLLAQAQCPIPLVIAGAHLGPEFGSGTYGANVELVADPPDATPLIHQAIMLVPLTIGGGSRLKVLEAFAAGTPVVSTTKGVEGLAAVPGVHFLPAETAEQFAAATLSLTIDTPLRQRITQAAWALVRERYSVAALTAQFNSGGDC